MLSLSSVVTLTDHIIGAISMLGFTDGETSERDGHYGLIGELNAPGIRRAVWPKFAAAALLLVGGSLGLVSVVGPHAAVTGAAFPATTMLKAAKSEDDTAADPACTTKPFGQCAGMNFSQPKDVRDAFNFSAPVSSLACCPDGMQCVTFGPVWGMCMPAWVAPKPKAAAALLSMMQQTALPYSATEPATELASTQAADPPNAEPCATKPYGQCSGMNFTKVDETGSKLAIADGAGPELTTCCPTNTNCVSFGPAWGSARTRLQPASFVPHKRMLHPSMNPRDLTEENIPNLLVAVCMPAWGAAPAPKK